MKKLVLSLVGFLLITPLFAQVPGISYQAVILNTKKYPGSEELLPYADQEVCLKFVLKNRLSTIDYEEIIATRTDAFGMVNVVIGSGERVGGTAASFAEVTWTAEAKFMDVLLDKQGLCVAFEPLSSQAFTAVPFALFASSAGTPGTPGPQGIQGLPGETGLTGAAGPQGPAGAAGLQGVPGPQGATGLAGAAGPAGATGPQGASGPAGASGTNGAAGLSAYQVWLALGNTGSEANFISALTGPQGTTGLQGPTGATGATGPAGATGPQGATGPAGASGTNGAAGLSAYQVWLALGNTGSEVNFISALTGPQGTTGLQGPTGAAGPAGADGAAASAATFVDLTTSQTINGAKIFTTDLTINGVKVGRGLGNNEQNVAIGADALASGTGTRNTAVGYGAMRQYSGASFDNNTSVGYFNLISLTSGSGNTSVGAESMMANTTGTENTSVGNQSLINSTGNNNVGIGKRSGQTITSGSQNTIVGTDADVSSASLSNATALGYGANITASNAVQLGNTNVTNVKTSGTLTAGTVTYPNTHNSTAGQVLTTDVAGTASWTTASGIPYTGATAAVNLGAYDLTVNGIIIGRGAGNINSNSIFGTNALESNTTGAYNVAFGNGALKYNTSGADNVAIGGDALNGIIDGTRNTAIGNNSGVAGGSGSLTNTTAIGYNAIVTTSNTIQLGNTDVTSVKTSGTITAKRYELKAPTAITAASTTTIDLSSGNVLTVNLGANISTITLSNAVVGTYLIKFVQDGTGSRTVTFPSEWKWSGGTIPTVTTAASKTDIVTLIYDGSTYYAAISQNF